MTLGVPIIQVPNTTGAIFSFGHTLVRIAGLEFTGGFTKIAYKRTRNREMAYSNHPDPVGKTLGQNAYEASATMYLAWWDAVQRKLGPGHGDIFFQILVSYSADGFNFIQDTINGCTIDETGHDGSAGTGALMREVSFSPTKIYFSGIEDVTVALQNAA